MIRVAVVDDHPLYRAGLATAIEASPNFELVDTAGSVEEFDQKVESTDIVLLDLHLPGIQGSDGVAHVCARGFRVIVVSAAGEPDDVVDAMAAGASGYLTKDADSEDVAAAIESVAAGNTYVSPTLASYLIMADRSAAVTEMRLSDRELEVLALVAGGDTDRDIAEQLNLSLNTVHSHLDRIRDKTGARRRAQLTKLAIERGITPQRDRPKR